MQCRMGQWCGWLPTCAGDYEWGKAGRGRGGGGPPSFPVITNGGGGGGGGEGGLCYRGSEQVTQGGRR